ncbi:hypothetical protein, conserved, partial [Eimeria tenella]
TFSVDAKHFPYAEAAAIVLQAYNEGKAILVFDSCGEIFAPGVAASFLVARGFGVIQAISHVRRKADYSKLDNTVVTELYRLAGGLRQPLDKGPIIGDEQGPLLISYPENPVDEPPNTEVLAAEALKAFLKTAKPQEAEEGLGVVYKLLNNAARNPHDE